MLVGSASFLIQLLFLTLRFLLLLTAVVSLSVILFKKVLFIFFAILKRLSRIHNEVARNYFIHRNYHSISLPPAYPFHKAMCFPWQVLLVLYVTKAT